MSNPIPYSIITAQAVAAHQAVLVAERGRATAPEGEPAPVGRGALAQLVLRLRRHRPVPVS
jgi:hypothetical protein